MHRLFVEKTASFANESSHLIADLRSNLAIETIASARIVQRYDLDGLTDAEFSEASHLILSEPQVDSITTSLQISPEQHAFAFSYLPGQFDQRADSAAQCIQILTGREKPTVFSSKIVILTGNLSPADLTAIKSYIINPVDSHEIPVAATSGDRADVGTPSDVAILDSFLTDSPETIRREMALAMSEEDIAFTQSYFRDEEKRAPSLTEIRMLDTYWSDHCRHTTFLTAIDEVTFAPGAETIEESYAIYRKVREKIGRDDKPVTLMAHGHRAHRHA